MEKTAHRKLKLGWISYLNLLPLKFEIQNQLGDFFDFSYGPPSLVNELMRKQEVDLAPSSSICLLKDNPFYTLPIGVCASGPVKSVYLGFQKEHSSFLAELRLCLKKYKFRTLDLTDNQKNYRTKARDYLAFQYNSRFKKIPPLLLTNQSETSAELGKILLTLLLGKRSLNQMCSKNRKTQTPPVELLIGDQALNERSRFDQILDLSELWFELTRLPFVFAVWQSHKKIAESTQTKLLTIARYAEETMHQRPEFYIEKSQEEKNIDLKSYWKNLSYQIDDKKQQGLRLFLELARLRINSSPLI